MTVGRVKQWRGGIGRGRGSFKEHGKCAASSSIVSCSAVSTRLDESSQPIGNVVAPVDLEPRPSLALRRSSDSRQKQSFESLSAGNLEDEIDPIPEAGNGSASAFSCSNNKRGRGQYKSKTIDLQTKNGNKITVEITSDTNRPVGPGSRDIANYCGLIMRNTISFRDGNWKEIASKQEEAMWLKVKDKFESKNTSDHDLRDYVIRTMQRLYRSWKSRLSERYHRYKNDKDRLSHRPSNVEPEDWKYLIGYFKTLEFKAIRERNMKNREKQITKHTCGTRSFAEVEESMRDPETGKKAAPDEIWEIQHTQKNDKGELVWLDPQSQLIHGQLKELVSQQKSKDVEDRMTNDEILVSALGERLGYVRGKGYGKKPAKKSHEHQSNLEVSGSSAMEIARHEMQAQMEQKLQQEREKLQKECENIQNEREQMAVELRREMERELLRKCEQEVKRKMEEEREHMKLDVNNMMKEQLASFMTRMQQKACSRGIHFAFEKWKRQVVARLSIVRLSNGRLKWICTYELWLKLLLMLVEASTIGP